MGRATGGVIGMRLADGDEVHRARASHPDGEEMISVSQNGYGKRSRSADYPTKGRGGKGVIGHQLTRKTGELRGRVHRLEGPGSPDDLIVRQGAAGRSRPTSAGWGARVRASARCGSTTASTSPRSLRRSSRWTTSDRLVGQRDLLERPPQEQVVYRLERACDDPRRPEARRSASAPSRRGDRTDARRSAPCWSSPRPPSAPPDPPSRRCRPASVGTSICDSTNAEQQDRDRERERGHQGNQDQQDVGRQVGEHHRVQQPEPFRRSGPPRSTTPPEGGRLREDRRHDLLRRAERRTENQ